MPGRYIYPEHFINGKGKKAIIPSLLFTVALIFCGTFFGLFLLYYIMQFLTFQVDESIISTSDHGDDHPATSPLPPPPLESLSHWMGLPTIVMDGSSSSSAAAAQETSSFRSASGSAAAGAASDVVTVATSEPVTHFNLDQLLEIVQSFQLDTTMAGHEEGKPQLDLAVARNIDMVKFQRYLLFGNGRQKRLVLLGYQGRL